MTINDCIHFANSNPICYLATAENGQPHVRALGFWFADESGFYFQIGTMKTMFKELESNPSVECCFYDNKTPIGTMLRVEGQIEFLDDKKLKEKVLIDRPFLKQFGLSAESPALCLFRIKSGRAHFWNMENNFKPKEYIHF